MDTDEIRVHMMRCKCSYRNNQRHTTIIDVDLTAYFDTINHSIMMEKLGRRINDPKLMMLIGRILKQTVGRRTPRWRNFNFTKQHLFK